jgi:hypothetical protein
MMKTIARRIKRLEEQNSPKQSEAGPGPVVDLLARRRKYAIAEGREPEPDLSPGPLIDSEGRRLLLSEILLQRRENENNAASVRYRSGECSNGC